MIKKPSLIFLFFLMFQLVMSAQNSYRLPKVLFVTCGADKGRGTVSDGVVLALQAFNRLGVYVRLEDRSALLRPEFLSGYDIMIIPTIISYHDKPQINSLTYMSGTELRNIAQWVKNGGTLVTDVNIGRNTLEGKDRFLKDGILNVNNWELGRCFGVALQEKNTSPYAIKDTGMGIWNKDILKKKKREIWRPVVVDYAPSVKILAQWYDDTESKYPAITLNSYGKGKAILLATFYILHPQSDGGLSSVNEIYDFYNFVYDTTLGERHYQVKVSPWEDGHSSVFCLSFDDGGNMEEYERIFNFVQQNEIPTVFFVTPAIDKDIIAKLKEQEFISVQGHSYTHPDFRKLDYHKTQTEFLMNRLFWNKDFTGFRFPYVSNSFWGMYLLDKLGFEYESSIAANNIDFIRGSIVPYNIPVFNDEFYTTLDLLEISQIYRSDWYFYKKVLDAGGYTVEEQKEDAQKFKSYLTDYFDNVVRPANGVMVSLGHPMYSGHSQYTLQALQEAYEYIKDKNVWIASMDEVAKRWNKLAKLNVYISEYQNYFTVEMDAAKYNIDKMTIILNQKPEKIVYTDKYVLKDIAGKYYLIFDLNNKAALEVHY